MAKFFTPGCGHGTAGNPQLPFELSLIKNNSVRVPFALRLLAAVRHDGNNVYVKLGFPSGSTVKRQTMPHNQDRPPSDRLVEEGAFLGSAGPQVERPEGIPEEVPHADEAEGAARQVPLGHLLQVPTGPLRLGTRHARHPLLNL